MRTRRNRKETIQISVDYLKGFLGGILATAIFYTLAILILSF